MLIAIGIVLAFLGIVCWEFCPAVVPLRWRPICQLAVFFGLLLSLVGFILHVAEEM